MFILCGQTLLLKWHGHLGHAAHERLARGGPQWRRRSQQERRPAFGSPYGLRPMGGTPMPRDATRIKTAAQIRRPENAQPRLIRPLPYATRRWWHSLWRLCCPNHPPRRVIPNAHELVDQVLRVFSARKGRP
jgi:hypothetical protein